MGEKEKRMGKKNDCVWQGKGEKYGKKMGRKGKKICKINIRGMRDY